MTPTKITLLTTSRTIRHIVTSLCVKYEINLVFNESDVIDSDIILIDDGANGLSYDKYKTTANRVALMINKNEKALGITETHIDKIIKKPFLPSEMARVILELESQTNTAYRDSLKQKIHHNFLVDSTLVHEQKMAAKNSIDQDKEIAQKLEEVKRQKEEIEKERIASAKIFKEEYILKKEQEKLALEKEKYEELKSHVEENIESHTHSHIPKNDNADHHLDIKAPEEINKNDAIFHPDEPESPQEASDDEKLINDIYNEELDKQKESGVDSILNKIKYSIKHKNIKVNKKDASSFGNIEVDFKNKANKDDDSIVSLSDIGDGGVLQSDDLLEVRRILKEDDQNQELVGAIDTLSVHTQKDEWECISQIVDESIKEYTFEIEEPIRFVLNAYSIQELEPLFANLDEQAVQSLIDGEEITFDIKMHDD